MSYSTPFTIALGDAYAGLTDVFAVLLDSSFDLVGSPQAMTEADSGFYGCILVVQDEFKGYVKAYSLATPSETLALGGVDPTL